LDISVIKKELQLAQKHLKDIIIKKSHTHQQHYTATLQTHPERSKTNSESRAVICTGTQRL
jgi:hypothetical protein